MEDEYRDKINEVINESQNHFEKNLVYLSASSLALSIGFVEKISNQKTTDGNWLIITSWLLLSLTLLLNLASHLISVSNSSTTRDEIDSNIPDKDLYKNITKRNKLMRKINWVTFLLFGFGVLISILYCSIKL